MEPNSQMSSECKFNQTQLSAEQGFMQGFEDNDAVFEDLFNNRFHHMKKVRFQKKKLFI